MAILLLPHSTAVHPKKRDDQEYSLRGVVPPFRRNESAIGGLPTFRGFPDR
jgi:hypothetical protein